MDSLIELSGVWFAWAHAIYGFVFLLLPAFFFADLALLAAVAWAAVSHSRGRQPWPSLPDYLRRSVRLAVEIAFGLINPVLYLAILTTSLPGDPAQTGRSCYMPAPGSCWRRSGP